jgi:hypothetical protein
MPLLLQLHVSCPSLTQRHAAVVVLGLGEAAPGQTHGELLRCHAASQNLQLRRQQQHVAQVQHVVFLLQADHPPRAGPGVTTMNRHQLPWLLTLHHNLGRRLLVAHSHRVCSSHR